MKQRRWGERTVSAVGLGCMNLSHAYGSPPSVSDAQRLLERAIDLGVTFFDTAALYGFGANESLLGRVLKPHRDTVTLCSKGGMAGVSTPQGVQRVIDGRPATLRKNCEDSLQRLGVECIDLYYLHRWDKKVPIEDSVGAMSDLVREGKVRHLGLCEVSGPTLRKAHAVHPITAVQTEYSLWTRNPEIAVLNVCRELGANLVAFSPLGRGFLTGELREVDTLSTQDIRRAMPRFSPTTYASNVSLLPAYVAVAEEVGCTPAQLALAWLLHQDPALLVIPGTRDERHLTDNVAAADVILSDQQLRRIDKIINHKTVQGERYSLSNANEVDTENFSANHTTTTPNL